MRTIELAGMQIRDFGSFQNASITFSRSPGFRFMTGYNAVEPALGSNGAGKSTLWNALTWINYGTSIKDQRASDLTRWGAKRPQGHCEWLVDDEPFIIERIGNPNAITINGEPVTQDAIDQLLGRNKKQFVQTVIYGQGARTFIDLSVPERAVVLDDILELGLWLNLSEHVGSDINAIEKEISALSHDISFENGRLEMLPDIPTLRNKSIEWDNSHADEIERMIQKVDAAEQEKQRLIKERNHLRNRTKEHAGYTDIENSLNTLETRMIEQDRSIGKLLQQVSTVQEHVAFFSNRNLLDCPTCGQSITVRFREQCLTRETDLMTDLRDQLSRQTVINTQLTDKRNDLRSDLDRNRRMHDHFNNQMRNADEAVRRQDDEIAHLAHAVEQFASQPNPWQVQIDETQNQRERIEERRAALVAQKKELEGHTMIGTFWRDAFKRIRLFEIGRILAHLELEIENAASSLGLRDWKIGVTTETETRSGTIRYGVQIQVTSPLASAPWESWSGGEGQRIRWAVAIGFASLIERMTGVRHTLEVWDEPSSFLSAEGIDDYLNCMRLRADMEHKALWLIDCGILTNVGFDEIWRVIKTENGSRVEMLASEE